MLTIPINGTAREALGKKATKADLKADNILCVLYGKGKENVHFTVKPLDVRELIYTGDFKLAEVNVNGEKHRCIVKAIQFHPVKDTINHIDFLELQDGHPVKVEVPVRFTGNSPGVRSGGKFAPSVRKIKIKATPELLVDEVVADISKLRLGETIRVRDIKLTPGVEILNPPALPIASVVIPRSLKGVAKNEEEAPGSPAEGTPAEGEE